MRLRIVLAATALAFAAPSTVQGAFIIGPVAASPDATLGTDGNTDPINVINQSGLSLPSYTSGVTDFNSYVASHTHDSSMNENIWLSLGNKTVGDFDFDLGGTYTIQAFALWNLPSSNIERVTTFELYASSDDSFTTTTFLGSFNTSPTGSADAVDAEVFTFTATSAAYVRMHIDGNAAGDLSNTSVGFGEAAFDGTPEGVTATPAPSSLVLLASGGIFGLACSLRRIRRGHFTASRFA